MQATEAIVLIGLIMLFAMPGIKDIVDVISCNKKRIKYLEDEVNKLKKKGN